jgi:microcystin-dependent protein
MTQKPIIRAPEIAAMRGRRQFRLGSGSKTRHGFALPTVLIVSVILLMLLVTGMSATVAVNNGLRDQYYTRLAELAVDAGDAFASACFTQNGNQITWSDENPLRPNTNCSGAVDSGLSAYVLNQDDVRTYFVVDLSMQAKGYTEGVRSSTNLAWRVWTSGSANAVQIPTASTPVGSYIEGAWTSAPVGYLLTNGTAVSRSTYANLFAVIGTSYGAGDGSTTFNLPNTQGRVTVARTTSTSSTFADQDGERPFDALGETSGKATHTLTLPQMPSHSHVEQFYDTTNGGLRAIAGSSTGGGGNAKPLQIGSGNSSTDVSTEHSGGGGAHDNVQPSIVVNRAIKY